jgi:diguanylate cyclase (GGDEF)-like protein
LLNEAIPACLRGDVWRGEMTLMDSEQNEVPVSQVLMAHRIQDPQAGECTVVSGIAWDIREMKQTENTLRHQATHDELTGLPNRLLFQSRLEQAVHAARLDQTLVAVLFMDINGFKQINDTRGHDAGDAVLREFGRRFDGRVRAADTVARFGGDEFVLLVPGLSVPSDVARVMEQSRAIVHEPFRIAEEQLDVTASIGFAMYPFDGLDAAALLRRADRTMYRNKRGLKIAS